MPPGRCTVIKANHIIASKTHWDLLIPIASWGGGEGRGRGLTIKYLDAKSLPVLTNDSALQKPAEENTEQPLPGKKGSPF